VRPLEDLVVIQLYDVGAIFDVVLDLVIKVLACDSEHEDEGGLHSVKQDLGQVRYVNQLKLEWEYQGLNGFTAVDQLDWV